MLSAPKTSPKDTPQGDGKKADAGRDAASDFIHDLAESGTANELGTVKAASDAVEGDTRKDRDKKPGEKDRENRKGD